MAYQWSKKGPLATLNATGGADTLRFSAGDETAIVRLADQTIEEVEFAYRGKNARVTHDEARHVVVGSKNWQRDVYHFLTPDGPAPTMRLGYTVHRGEGTWSSLPHDFEEQPEPGFEEIFFYRLQGGTRRAVQVGRGLWCDGTVADGIWPVFNDTFGVIPMGYHPVAGEPGVRVMYVWVYLAKKPRWEKI